MSKIAENWDHNIDPRSSFFVSVIFDAFQLFQRVAVKVKRITRAPISARADAPLLPRPPARHPAPDRAEPEAAADLDAPHPRRPGLGHVPQ
jgi:hypothetical protein